MRIILLFSAILSITSFASSQPQTIELTMDWLYDFGSVNYDRINMFTLCDPDSDGIPDLFCNTGSIADSNMSISRLIDNQLLWSIDDHKYIAKMMKVFDHDYDGVQTLWISSTINDSMQALTEFDIISGQMIQEIDSIDCNLNPAGGFSCLY